MSRRDLRPGQHWPAPRGTGPRSAAGTARLVASVLAREACIALVLWSVRGTAVLADVAASVLLFVPVIVGTRSFGMLRPRGWLTAAREGALLFAGGYCMANIIRLTVGAAPWFGYHS